MQALKDRGLRTPNSIKLQYDFNPGLGGPLKENKLWFYAVGAMGEDAELRRRHVLQQERRHSRMSGPTIRDLSRPSVSERVPAQRERCA